MTENERVKALRKARGLTLEQFGARLGVSKAAISRIENGINSITDQMRRSICREFGVREEWLRDGDGEMEDSVSRSAAIDEAVRRLMTGESADFKRRLIVALSALNEDQWVFLRQKMEEIVGVSVAAPPAPMTREQCHAELDRQLDDEEKAGERSSASGQLASGSAGA